MGFSEIKTRQPESEDGPTFAHLPNLDARILSRSSLHTNSVCRKLLRGAKVLLVGVGPQLYVVNRLIDLGIHLHIVDVPETAWDAFVTSGVISSFVPFDLYQRKQLNASDIVEKVRLATGNVQFDAVTTYHDEHVETALQVADAYGVARNDVNAGTLARNKVLARKAMEAAGLPVVKHAIIRGEDDIAYACDHVPFPAVLKPSFGFYSIAVKRLDSKDDLLPYYRHVKQDSDGQGNALWSQGVHMILEEYLDGDEFDVDAVFSYGKAVYCNVVDNHRTMEPWFPGMGGKVPSSYPEEKQAQIRSLGIAAARALGFRFGVVDVEVRWTSRGPRVLEVNGRPPCSANPIFHLHGWGIDLLEAHITAMLGIPFKPYVSSKPLSQLVSFEANAPYSGTVCCENWLDFCKHHGNVVKVSYMKKMGDEVVGPEDAVPSLIGRVILQGDDMGELLQVMGNIFNKQANVPITPKDGQQAVGFYFNTYC